MPFVPEDCFFPHIYQGISKNQKEAKMLCVLFYMCSSSVVLNGRLPASLKVVGLDTR